MSCFIVGSENIRQQAEFISFLLNNDSYAVYGMYAPESVKAVFSDCITCRQYDAHKIYRKLYIANLRAYNGRYSGSDAVKEFEKYKPSAPPHNMPALYKHMQCYLYQCAEDPVYNTPLYNAIRDLKNALAAAIIDTLPEYVEAEWD